MSGHSAVTAIVIDTGADDPAGRLAALFDAHQDRLYRLARRLVPTRDDARDLVQEAFLRAAAAPRSVPVGHAGEEAWLVRVLINIRRDQWRRAVVRHRADPLLHASAVAEESSHASAAIARATIWRALDVLHPRRRAVVVMHELDGMTFSAIASLLGIAILIDGDVVSAPTLRDPISTSAVIDGHYTREEAERIVAGIRGR